MKRNVILIAVMSYAATMSAGLPKGELVDTSKVHQLQEVQVVSTRASQKTPMAFKDLNKEQIKGVNYGQDIPFVLSLTPSVTISSDAGNGVGYTGIHVRGTDPSRINITTNGIPVNDAESNQVYWVNMPDFASSIESMQIQRGVGTSTNGGGAFGATINMQTENIGVKPFAGFDASAGSYGTHKETLRFGTGLLGGHWGFQGRLSNIGSDGYIDRASAKLNSYFLQGGYFSDNTVVKFITFNGTERTYHAWDYASKDEMETYGRRYNPCGKMGKDADGNPIFYRDQTDNYHQQNYQLLWNQILNDYFNINVALHYTHGYGYYEQYKRSTSDYPLYLAQYNLTTDWTKASDLVRRKIMKNDFYGTVASVNYNSKKGMTASLGGGWNKYDGNHYGNVIWVKNFDEALTPNQKYYDNNAKKYDFNVYGKANYEFIDGLNAFVDLQYRHVGLHMHGPTDAFSDKVQQQFNDHFTFDFFNPKAGLYFDIDNNNKVYASFAVSHKEPTRNDFEDNMGTKLKAERLYDWEAGYKYMSRTFSAGINFYYMDYNDQFVLTGEKNPIGEAIARNVGKSYREGIELEAAYKPFDWFKWDANATFSRNRAKDWHVTLDDTGESVNLGNTNLSFSPDIIFNNIFTFNYKGLKACLQSQYIGKQYMTNSGFKSYVEDGKEVSMLIDAYFISNLDLSYTLKLKGLKDVTVGCTIYNLFSEKYENNGFASAQYKSDGKGGVVAYQDEWWDSYSVYSAQAPINFMAHVSLNF
jgi:iron complex outermembrane receptor protein